MTPEERSAIADDVVQKVVANHNRAIDLTVRALAAGWAIVGRHHGPFMLDVKAMIQTGSEVLREDVLVLQGMPVARVITRMNDLTFTTALEDPEGVKLPADPATLVALFLARKGAGLKT